jgi:hypothetical protein|tara:strand:+ start:908 stop:1177 length:270 start_codon:yes stop_codon:yes gene_type:complete
MKRKKKGVTPQTVEDVVAQANEAETLLQSPVFMQACDLLEDKYINQWMSSAWENEEVRVRCYRFLHVLTDVKSELESMINSGKIAKQST